SSNRLESPQESGETKSGTLQKGLIPRSLCRMYASVRSSLGSSRSPTSVATLHVRSSDRSKPRRRSSRSRLQQGPRRVSRDLTKRSMLFASVELVATLLCSLPVNRIADELYYVDLSRG